MPDTLNLLELDTPHIWYDVFAETGIAVGSAITINFYETTNQNYVEYSITDSEPALDSKKLIKVSPFEGQYVLPSGASGLWVKPTSEVKLSVQEGIDGLIEGGGGSSGSSGGGGSRAGTVFLDSGTVATVLETPEMGDFERCYIYLDWFDDAGLTIPVVAPTTGTVTEVNTSNGVSYQSVLNGTDMDVTLEDYFVNSVIGKVTKVKATPTGITGATHWQLRVERY